MSFFLFYTNENNKSNTVANFLLLHLLYLEDCSVSVNKVLLVLHKCNFSLFSHFFVHHASCSSFLPFWIQLPFFLNNNPELIQQNLKMCFSASLLNANLSLYRIQGYHPFIIYNLSCFLLVHTAAIEKACYQCNYSFAGNVFLVAFRFFSSFAIVL